MTFRPVAITGGYFGTKKRLTMEVRFNIAKEAPGVYEALLASEKYLHHCSIEMPLIHLIKLRTSQINGCAYCLDMHWKDLRALGESEQRLYALDAWRECTWYSERERAALAWAEAVTLVGQGHVPDAVYNEACKHFNAKELSDLTFAVCTINSWNRLSIASRTPAGTYEVKKAKEQVA